MQSWNENGKEERKTVIHSLTSETVTVETHWANKQSEKNSQTNIRSIGQTIRQRSTSGLNMVEQPVTPLNSQKSHWLSLTAKSSAKIVKQTSKRP